MVEHVRETAFLSMMEEGNDFFLISKVAMPSGVLVMKQSYIRFSESGFVLILTSQFGNKWPRNLPL